MHLLDEISSEMGSMEETIHKEGKRGEKAEVCQIIQEVD